MRVALMANMPAPYRVPVYDRLADALGDDFLAIYMRHREGNRMWNVPDLGHEHVVLEGRTVTLGDREIHVRRGAWKALRSFQPDVVITGSFNPPMLAGWAYTRRAEVAHVAMSDSWARSEAHLSIAHRLVRKLVYGRTSAFVGASRKSLELFESYGAARHLFHAPLGIDNERFAAQATRIEDRPYDLVFAGNLIARKLPLFFADVATALARRRDHVRVLVVGDGDLREATESALKRAPRLEATFTGFLQQAELPAAYAMGKLFLFPTENDPWGVVANEACAAGLPVLTCDNAGCAGELVVHERNGLVLPLDAERWASAAAELLDAPSALRRMSDASHAISNEYTYDIAAKAFLDACAAAHRGTLAS